jgi:glycosyltransferase involved in cell wall biosynthesis
MKIAILSPIHWRTPPRKYGPWELIASYIAEGMVKKGHDVTLYATGDSQTTGKLRWVCPRPVKEDESLEPKVYQYLHTAKIFEEAAEYDIIHNHYDVYPLVFSKLIKTSVVTTMHGFSSPQAATIARKYSNTHFVSISYADRKHAPDLNWIANIYHGIPVESYEFTEKPSDYFLFLGRISPDKGVHLSVKLARTLGIKLKIAGLLEDQKYFDDEIKPFLGKNVEFLGEVANGTRTELLKNALGFLHLNTYPEGFGLTLVESMASGTPVIGMDRGSLPEVVENNKTGYVVSSLEEVKKAIKNIGNISRKDCRDRVMKLFSLGRMVDEYEAVYKNIIAGTK